MFLCNIVDFMWLDLWWMDMVHVAMFFFFLLGLNIEEDFSANPVLHFY